MKKIAIILTGLLMAVNLFAMEIEITIGDKTVTAEIEDSETGRAFCALLPMTINMSELNGNEKYHYLSNPLPTDTEYYRTIESGDLMLYGNTCVVLFYGNAGGYSYTRIGRLTSTYELADAVGNGNISVSFSLKNSSTAIQDIPLDINEGKVKIYDLNGRLLHEEPQKGIFVKNGKLIVK
ncbi:MAG: hypothetical protein MJ198_06285 [Bacteroidales bacterium]|nr:hypothetical protein [Bacteroidales bacterium]